MEFSNFQLEVNCGYMNEKLEVEGYYISKLKDHGATPITKILATSDELTSVLNKMDVAYCF